MLQGLAEGRAAVAEAVQERPDVEVGIEVEDADWPLGGDVAEVMSIRRLVAAAKDDGDGAALQDRADDLSQGVLALFEAPRGLDIAQVERGLVSQINPAGKVAGGQPAEEPAYFVGSRRGAHPTPVATYPLVLREADEHCPTGKQRGGIALPRFDDLAQAWVVRAP
jgi:hypothetical protein